MDENWVQPRSYRLVLRGELGDSFGVLFDGMQLQRLSGHDGADRRRDRSGAPSRAHRASPGTRCRARVRQSGPRNGRVKARGMPGPGRLGRMDEIRDLALAARTTRGRSR